MTIILGDLRKALVEAGASDEAAENAAKEVADFYERTHKLESAVSNLKYMVATNIVLTVAVLGILLRVPGVMK